MKMNKCFILFFSIFLQAVYICFTLVASSSLPCPHLVLVVLAPSSPHPRPRHLILIASSSSHHPRPRCPVLAMSPLPHSCFPRPLLPSSSLPFPLVYCCVIFNFLHESSSLRPRCLSIPTGLLLHDFFIFAYVLAASRHHVLLILLFLAATSSPPRPRRLVLAASHRHVLLVLAATSSPPRTASSLPPRRCRLAPPRPRRLLLLLRATSRPHVLVLVLAPAPALGVVRPSRHVARHAAPIPIGQWLIVVCFFVHAAPIGREVCSRNPTRR